MICDMICLIKCYLKVLVFTFIDFLTMILTPILNSTYQYLPKIADSKMSALKMN